MASDDAYAAFLEKANEDPSAGRPSVAASSSKKAATKDHQQNVPKALVAAAQDQFYTSDADEPFVAVALPLKGGSGLPTEGELSGGLLKADGILLTTAASALHSFRRLRRGYRLVTEC